MRTATCVLSLAIGLLLSACGAPETATVATLKAKEAREAQQTLDDVKAQMEHNEALQRDRLKALEAADR